MVDVWYPAQVASTAKPAPYIPDLPSFERSLSQAELKDTFGRLSPIILPLRTHAVEDAPFAGAVKYAPLLVFSHGGGVFRAHYTAQFEDLASHGYVVVSIGHTYDTGITVFPNGRVIHLSNEGAPAPGASDEEIIRHQNDRRLVQAADIRFVIDQLSRRDGLMSHAPFAGHIDVHRIGAFGHSAGGRAAALACQTDARIAACLNEDGVANNLPFDRRSDSSTMRQPFLYFGRHRKPPPSDAQLREMKMTRSEFNDLIRSVDKKQDDLLADLPSGYRVTLSTCQVEHFSFTDFPFLEAGGDRTKQACANLTLKIIRAYVVAFFDRYLKKQPGLLELPVPDDWPVSVERFHRQQP
jgi:predicted dienelactone hydrolase